jgi:hypothetical protein
MVVPISAPRITPMDCVRVMTPALTNPTTKTVVIELDCIMDVTISPTASPLNLLLVTVLIIFLRPSPATACMPFDMLFMPMRKRANPPISWKIMPDIIS